MADNLSYVDVYNSQGSGKRGKIVKQYPRKKGLLGTFFCVRFARHGVEDVRVNLYCIPPEESLWVLESKAWHRFYSINMCTVVGPELPMALSHMRCLLFAAQVSEEEADETVLEMASWALRREDFLKKLHAGQICYTTQDVEAAKERGFTKFVKNEFSVGGYYTTEDDNEEPVSYRQIYLNSPVIDEQVDIKNDDSAHESDDESHVSMIRTGAKSVRSTSGQALLED